MTLDADNYRINIPVIAHLTKELSESNRLEFISNLSIITGVPIIVVCSYIGEIYGRSQELINRQKKLMDFYHVTEVLNERTME